MALRHDLLSYNVKRTTAHTGSPVARSRDPDPPQTDALRWMCKASSVRADALRTHSAQSRRRGAVRRASGPGPPAVTARGESASQPPRDYRPHLCRDKHTPAAPECRGRPRLPARHVPAPHCGSAEGPASLPSSARVPNRPCTGRGLEPTPRSREVSSDTRNKSNVTTTSINRRRRPL